jgi:DNA polymerase-3 subunit epsilon
MEFFAIDVETANADMSSICQIDIAKFKDNKLIDEWCSLIDPGDYFDPMNIVIHGITESDVEGAPKFEDVAEKLYGYLDNALTVCHTHFDKVPIAKAFKK